MDCAYHHIGSLIARGPLTLDDVYEAVLRLKRERAEAEAKRRRQRETERDVEAAFAVADELNAEITWPGCCPVSPTVEDVRRATS